MVGRWSFLFRCPTFRGHVSFREVLSPWFSGWNRFGGDVMYMILPNGGWSLKGVFFFFFFKIPGRKLGTTFGFTSKSGSSTCSNLGFSMFFDGSGCWGWKVKESAGMLECWRLLENIWHVYNSYQVCWFEWVCLTCYQFLFTLILGDMI